ncbi:hypothetical protein [Filibacter tadaridae]|uniref:hypothetical protein n=1 Tax=Filibacter tadaridae TaxID=2483811 RepID=UPI000F54BE15|nr:hypothetical protein [Filibacter tadaridae]
MGVDWASGGFVGCFERAGWWIDRFGACFERAGWWIDRFGACFERAGCPKTLQSFSRALGGFSESRKHSESPFFIAQKKTVPLDFRGTAVCYYFVNSLLLRSTTRFK